MFGNKEQLVEDLAQAIFEQDEEQRLIKDIQALDQDIGRNQEKLQDIGTRSVEPP